MRLHLFGLNNKSFGAGGRYRTYIQQLFLSGFGVGGGLSVYKLYAAALQSRWLLFRCILIPDLFFSWLTLARSVFQPAPAKRERSTHHAIPLG